MGALRAKRLRQRLIGAPPQTPIEGLPGPRAPRPVARPDTYKAVACGVAAALGTYGKASSMAARTEDEKVNPSLQLCPGAASVDPGPSGRLSAPVRLPADLDEASRA
ncbi:hypothetical protein GCM10010149_67700 [Nonomuraea roseoviolacea subsp. roseoviolacea]